MGNRKHKRKGKLTVKQPSFIIRNQDYVFEEMAKGYENEGFRIKTDIADVMDYGK